MKEDIKVILVIIASVLTVVMLISLVTLSIAIPIERIKINGQIEQFISTKQSLENARKNKNINLLEIAAIQQKVIESNQWLADKKYMNKTIFNIFIPDKINEIQPIN